MKYERLSIHNPAETYGKSDLSLMIERLKDSLRYWRDYGKNKENIHKERIAKEVIKSLGYLLEYIPIVYKDGSQRTLKSSQPKHFFKNFEKEGKAEVIEVFGITMSGDSFVYYLDFIPNKLYFEVTAIKTDAPNNHLAQVPIAHLNFLSSIFGKPFNEHFKINGILNHEKEKRTHSRQICKWENINPSRLIETADIVTKQIEE